MEGSTRRTAWSERDPRVLADMGAASRAGENCPLSFSIDEASRATSSYASRWLVRRQPWAAALRQFRGRLDDG